MADNNVSKHEGNAAGGDMAVAGNLIADNNDVSEHEGNAASGDMAIAGNQ